MRLRRRALFLGVVFVLSACLALPGLARAQPRAASIGTTLDQCQNGTSGIDDCTGNAWITGDLNPNNALYREGDFVPFRSVITGLAAGHSYTLRIGYDAVDKGLHAYDYLGSVDGSESAPGQLVIPCYGVAGTGGPHACGNGPDKLAVPKDVDTTFPSGSQVPGAFSAWGANLTHAAYVNPSPIGAGTTGQVARQIDVTFAADGDTVVLAWGGHIASVLDWGPGETFISAASGASFHMRLVQVGEVGGTPGGTGNRERSLHATALAPVPSPFTTTVDKTSVAIGQPVVDTAQLAGRAGLPVTGSVQFFVCYASGGPPDCTQGGLAIDPAQVVVAPSPGSADGIASIQFIPGTPGSYCFRAEYAPSTTAPYSPAAHTNTTTECFVATLPPPQLAVTKVCDPRNDPGLFDLLLDGVALITDAPCGASTGPFDTTAGTHTVSETAGTGTNLGDYTSVIGGSCDAAGSITLAAGDSSTCTITNSRIPLVPASLTLTKVCAPPDDDGQFELHIDDLRFPDVACGGTTGSVLLAPGPHTVGEAGGANTSLSDYTSVIGGDCAADGTVALVAGGSAACTITNTRIPPPATTIRVNKACDPLEDGGRFNLKIDGKVAATVSCGGSTGVVDVSPGSHTVSESGANGTDISGYTSVIGGDCGPDGTITVATGDAGICLITNVRKPVQPLPAQLTVSKVCVPADDGGLFNLTIDGQTAPDRACGERFGPVIVSPGQHQVGESAGTGTSATNYTSSIGGGCAPDGTVTLRAGESVTCTITNVRANSNEQTATIAIEKHCVPAGSPGRFHLELDQQVFQNMACGQSTGPITVATGLHVVGEAGVNPNAGRYTATIGGSCAADGSITLAAGQQATCIVTNELKLPNAGRPPGSACYRLTIKRRMVSVGSHVVVLARVLLRRRPVQGVRVYAAGPGVSTFRTTGPRGRARFVLNLRRPGIVVLRLRKPFKCPKPPPREFGVLGARQPSLTG